MSLTISEQKKSVLSFRNKLLKHLNRFCFVNISVSSRQFQMGVASWLFFTEQTAPFLPFIKKNGILLALQLKMKGKKKVGECLLNIFLYNKHIIRHFLTEFFHTAIEANYLKLNTKENILKILCNRYSQLINYYIKS